MADAYEFPTDLGDDPEPARDAMRWTGTVIALSALGLASLNPGAIDDWLNDLPPTPLTQRLAAMSDAYVGSTMGMTLGTGHARMRAAWKAAENADWSGRQPVETADASNPKS